jgi:hypothetical protein
VPLGNVAHYLEAYYFEKYRFVIVPFCDVSYRYVSAP